MESGTHPSPFPVLCVSDAKQVPIYSWVDRECSSRRMAKPGFELTTSRRLSASLPHNRVVLTTRSRDFSSGKKTITFALFLKWRSHMLISKNFATFQLYCIAFRQHRFNFDAIQSALCFDIHAIPQRSLL